MPTEAQIEAARAEFRRRWPEVSPSKDMMRACLEAAERAAWSTDMEAAPEGPSLLYLPVNEYGGEMTDVDGPEGYMFDEATAWRPFPGPPEARDD